ncbi:uncharacterized protein LOC114062509 isoform X2 [Empidonax traillii]|uniref:uncharacterized protein LOC114062509 isoform X2 n=1 Tax=Empidonax traillii TaxID=164674 RepID=UPI000FFCF9A3|nr:uncharacterized protein LOC114062509 isoform X2 [Empidonax traillii]
MATRVTATGGAPRPPPPAMAARTDGLPRGQNPPGESRPRDRLPRDSLPGTAFSGTVCQGSSVPSLPRPALRPPRCWRAGREGSTAGPRPSRSAGSPPARPRPPLPACRGRCLPALLGHRGEGSLFAPRGLLPPRQLPSQRPRGQGSAGQPSGEFHYVRECCPSVSLPQTQQPARLW